MLNIRSYFAQKHVTYFLLLNLECYNCARMRFHWANVLVVLRICATYREHWS